MVLGRSVRWGLGRWLPALGLLGSRRVAWVLARWRLFRRILVLVGLPGVRRAGPRGLVLRRVVLSTSVQRGLGRQSVLGLRGPRRMGCRRVDLGVPARRHLALVGLSVFRRLGLRLLAHRQVALDFPDRGLLRWVRGRQLLMGLLDRHLLVRRRVVLSLPRPCLAARGLRTRCPLARRLRECRRTVRPLLATRWPGRCCCRSRCRRGLRCTWLPLTLGTASPGLGSAMRTRPDWAPPIRTTTWTCPGCTGRRAVGRIVCCRTSSTRTRSTPSRPRSLGLARRGTRRRQAGSSSTPRRGGSPRSRRSRLRRCPRSPIRPRPGLSMRQTGRPRRPCLGMPVRRLRRGLRDSHQLRISVLLPRGMVLGRPSGLRMGERNTRQWPRSGPRLDPLGTKRRLGVAIRCAVGASTRADVWASILRRGGMVSRLCVGPASRLVGRARCRFRLRVRPRHQVRVRVRAQPKVQAQPQAQAQRQAKARQPQAAIPIPVPPQPGGPGPGTSPSRSGRLCSPPSPWARSVRWPQPRRRCWA